MDARSNSVLTFDGCIEFVDNEPCLSIEGKINASMKDNAYDCRAVFTHKDLVCCSCDCKSGSWDDERITCVHVPAVGVLLSHLLMDGLAEHTLIELASLWPKSFPDFDEPKKKTTNG